MSTSEHISALSIGDKVRFTPGDRKAWRVAARNADHVVLVRQAAFQPRGTLEYCVTGTLNGGYNGQPAGPVRSSLNTLGGGFDVGPNGERADEIIAALESGERQLSMRRVLRIDAIEAVNS